MGNACKPCQSTKNHQQQLEQLFKNDSKTGTVIQLTPQKKLQFWTVLQNKQFSVQNVEPIYPFENNATKGFQYLPNKYLYEGSFQDKKIVGKGRLILIDDQIIYQGSFDDNKIDGSGTITSVSQGMTIRGRWKKGFPVSIKFESEDEQYEIKFKQNCLNQGEIKFNNGRKYIGKFNFNLQQKQSLIQGQGKIIYKNGDQLQGNFKNGLLSGKGLYRANNRGYSYQGQFQGGLFQGEGIFFFSKNQFLKINWLKNQPHGTGTYTKDSHTYVVKYNQGIRSYSQNIAQ